MFGIDLILLGFFATLGGKGAIDTYDGVKSILTDAVQSKTVNNTIEKVKGAGTTVVDTVVEGAKDAKKVVVEASHKAHETIDNTLNIHKNEHRVGADGDKVKAEASAT